VHPRHGNGLRPLRSDASCTRTRRFGAEPQSHREESENVGSDLIKHRAAPSRASSSDRRQDSRRGEGFPSSAQAFVHGRDSFRIVGASSLSRGPTPSGLGFSPRAHSFSKSRATDGRRQERERRSSRTALRRPNRPPQTRLETRSAQRRREASSASLPFRGVVAERIRVPVSFEGLGSRWSNASLVRRSARVARHERATGGSSDESSHAP